MAASAIRFCGDEIGELCPPILAASAIASYYSKKRVTLKRKKKLIYGELTIRQGPKVDLGGNVRKIGYEEKILSDAYKSVRVKAQSWMETKNYLLLSG